MSTNLDVEFVKAAAAKAREEYGDTWDVQEYERRVRQFTRVNEDLDAINAEVDVAWEKTKRGEIVPAGMLHARYERSRAECMELLGILIAHPFTKEAQP